MNTLAILREMREELGEQLQERKTRRDVWVEGCTEYIRGDVAVCETEERVETIDRAIADRAIVTEAEALLPFFRDIAKTHALGDAGDLALARLIKALEVG